MVETLRHINIKIMAEIDTNKSTYRKTFEIEHYENVEETFEAVNEWIEMNLP